MNRPVKALLILVALLAALSALAWTGMFLYWHVTIRTEIQEIENQFFPTYDRLSGGCRSMPYCIEALETSRNLGAMDTLTWNVVRGISGSGRPTATEEMTEFWRLAIQHRGEEDVKPERRWARYRKILEWWQENGGKYHQWWRVWSPCCGQ